MMGDIDSDTVTDRDRQYADGVKEAAIARPPCCGRSRKDGPGIQDLPNEVLDHILSFLDKNPPSIVNIHQWPVLHTLTHNSDRYLKALSLTCRQLRTLTLARLFKHTTLAPRDLDPFLSFLTTKSLTTNVETVFAQIFSNPSSLQHPLWWASLLNTLQGSFRTLTIAAPPFIFADLASTSIVDMDSWAFNMPLQSITFGQSRSASRLPIFLDHSCRNLLTARPWTSFSVNEGSSLKAYSQYEYFMKRTPSLLSAFTAKPNPDALELFANLQSFSYTAVFPFYNHVDEVLKLTRQMHGLKSLTMKLCPEPGSNVVDEETIGGHIDMNDAWMEFDTSYSLVSHTVEAMGVEKSLVEFRAQDVRMDGIRDHLIGMISQKLKRWAYAGDGLWRKDTPAASNRDENEDVRRNG